MSCKVLYNANHTNSPPMISRRRFLAAAIGATPVATVLYTLMVEPHWLAITKPTLTLPMLPRELEGCTLAQLTDLHVGPEVSDEYIIHCFKRVTALRPDFVVYTGDWITYREYAQITQLERVLQFAPLGRLATIGVLGNHDYGYGWHMQEVAEQVASVARNAGITMLRNESLTVHGLQFVGLDDFWSPNFNPRPVLESSAAASASIILCHNPDAADRPVWTDVRGWILAGHTHGGQCKPPFLPPPLIPVRNPRYTSGAFQLSDGRTMYISRGVGHLLKARFNARPEIPLFQLHRA